MPSTKYEFDIIAIGDSTLDTFLKIDDATVLCTIKKEMCWLCLNYADKIPVTRLDHSLGGNASNLVVGSSRLGLKAAIYTILGDDDTGHRVLDQFKLEGVSAEYVKILRRRNTNYSVVINFQSQRTILGYHEKRAYDLPKLAPARFIYLTSMGPGCESVYDSLLKYAAKYQSKLCFGPGTYQRKSGFSSLQKIINDSYLYISNKEEAESIFQHQKETEKSDGSALYMKGLLHEAFRHGPRIVVITDGPRGAYAYDGKHYFYAAILDVPVVEPTGAGDSFSTGLLAAIACGHDLDEALKWATFNSASVIQEIGSQKGLLDSQGIKKYYTKYKDYQVKRI